MDALGCRIVRADGFDTDQLGTFTRDIERRDSQLQTARTKARKGMDLLGLSLGLASEGSFPADPFIGHLPWNVEALVWLDDESELELVGMAQGPAISVQGIAKTMDELLILAERAEFPQHQLTLRPNNEHDIRIRKGIATLEALQQSFVECLDESTNRSVFVESDLRAFCNPTRQALIVRAADDLIQKINSICPRCSLPGYWVTEHRPGLLCAACHAPTRLAIASIWRCGKCPFSHEEAVGSEQLADPGRCDYCNP